MHKVNLLCSRGHASEKPELPTALAETPSGIRFLGPPANAMAALGDKIGSTILAQAAGVPTIPWSGSGVAVDFDSCGGMIPPEIYKQVCPCLQHIPSSTSSALDCRGVLYGLPISTGIYGIFPVALVCMCCRKNADKDSTPLICSYVRVCPEHKLTSEQHQRRQQEKGRRFPAVSGLPASLLLQACLHNVEEALTACKRIGYPIMLKASWGGGGKGIRKVRSMLVKVCRSSAPTCLRMGNGFLAPVHLPLRPSAIRRLMAGTCGHAGPER